MPNCPYCGTSVPEGAIECGKCGAILNGQDKSVSTPFQSQPLNSQPPHDSSPWGNQPNYHLPPTRLERALKRSEQLSYAAIGLGAVILVLLLVIFLLP